MIRQLLSAFGYERRSDSPYAPDTWGYARRPSVYASPAAVMSNLAVAVRCISLRSELLASVPLKLYRRTADGDRERVTDHPLADVLADLSNPLTTAYELREGIVRDLDTHGNHYSRIERDAAGQASALWRMEPGRVQVERLENGRLRYRYSGERGPVVLLQDETLHIRASSEDGVLGISPIARARGALNLAITQAQTMETISADGFRIAGVVTHPGKLSPTARKNVLDTVEKPHQGPQNAGRVALFEEGMRFQPTQFSPLDAELLESKKLSNEDTARIFGVPPASVGISNSVSYGSAQQAAQDLVSNALAPLASRIEQAMQRCLLTPRGRRSFIIEHDLSGLLRGDATSRWTAYKIGREIGVLGRREIRRIENLGPMDPADEAEAAAKATQPEPEPPIASIKE